MSSYFTTARHDELRAQIRTFAESEVRRRIDDGRLRPPHRQKITAIQQAWARHPRLKTRKSRTARTPATSITHRDSDPKPAHATCERARPSHKSTMERGSEGDRR